MAPRGLPSSGAAGWRAPALVSHLSWTLLGRTLLLIGIVPVALLIALQGHLPQSTGLGTSSPTVSYSIRILSWDPLIIYLVNFLSLGERKALLDLGETLFERSTVDDNGVPSIDSTRSSSTAFLHAPNALTESIIARSSQLQGFTPRHFSETLQLTRYRAGQQYRPHFDPIAGQDGAFVHRLTTIFVCLEATCTECGTQFPNIHIDWSMEHPSWCDYVDCEQEALTIRAIPGNAILWKSWNSSGQVDERTLHAGLPPEKGVKTGLNIWTNG